MELIRGIYNVKERHRNCVITIGNFDGLHLGHLDLLKCLKNKAKSLQQKTLVIIFEPQPNEYFANDNAPARLMRFREKIEGLKELGIDLVLCLPFNADLAQQSAEDFIKTLVSKLAPSYFLVGDDFRFGCQRRGDIVLLQQLGKQLQFAADQLPTFIKSNERVSSTRVRELLKLGDLATVHKLLGRSFTLKGRVAKGDQRGRLLGFPTANIHLHRRTVPINGVFTVSMENIANDPIPGVANIGTRPTISGGTKSLLEVHLLDFDQEIYGKHVTVNFLYKLRDEQKFTNLSALQEQIAQDVIAAREFFAMNSL